MQRKFLTYSLLFFIPVILGYMVMEYLALKIPSSYQSNTVYLEKESGNIKTLVLGSSQIQSGVNPEWLSSPSLNLSSGNQHHDTDFKLLKGIKDRLPKLETIVIEVSYSHFELPHNGKDFWKNSVYLKYYNINAFERNTYFKDKLIYLSSPKLFSERIMAYHIDKSITYDYNTQGFNLNNYYGQFKDLNHDEQKIADMSRFKINTTPNLNLFKTNTALFNEILEYAKKNNLQVVISKLPMYKTYHDKKHPDILKRRNDFVSEILLKYDNIKLFDLENDTVNYTVKDYWNQSHLNPKGAKKYTDTLNSFIESIK